MPHTFSMKTAFSMIFYSLFMPNATIFFKPLVIDDDNFRRQMSLASMLRRPLFLFLHTPHEYLLNAPMPCVMPDLFQKCLSSMFHKMPYFLHRQSTVLLYSSSPTS